MRYDTPLGDALYEFAARINSPRSADFVSSVLGQRVTWLQVSTVWHIAWSPGMRQSDVARRIGLEPATMSKVVSRLAEMQLVRVESDPEDQRVRRLHLAPEGERVAGALFDGGNEIFKRAGVEAHSPDVDAAIRVIRRLLDVTPNLDQPNIPSASHSISSP